LNQLIVGKEILDIWTDTPKMVKPSLKTVKKAIVGTKIRKLARRAKLLQVFLSSGQVLAFHLKMTGRLLYRSQKAKKDDWVRVVVKLKGKNKKGKTEEHELRFSDLRKFGWVKLIKNKKELKKVLAEFGPEPMDDLNLKTFKKALASTARPVKVAILDQKKISGVGNIYACDALFLAKIDPQKPANKLDAKEAKKLYEAIIKVLKAGIKYRGASDQYYLDALGHKGAYQDHFLVYAREGKKCFGCKGKVAKMKVAGRGTYYCPDCQQ
jgi:formamidopyrimidine-DNA glycosylase